MFAYKIDICSYSSASSTAYCIQVLFHFSLFCETDQLAPWYSDCMKNRRRSPQARILFNLLPPIRTGNSKMTIFNSSQDLSLILLSNNEKCVTFLPPQLRCPDFVSVSRISPLFPTSDPFLQRCEFFVKTKQTVKTI